MAYRSRTKTSEQNWPRWKRDLTLFILCLISVIASALSPLLAANTLTLSLWFGLPFTQIALLTGYNLLGVGVAGFIFVASARVWGKRHLYLLGTILVVIGSAWGGATGTNYTSLLWARIIQGVGLAPFEALVNASVGDLYFVHVRIDVVYAGKEMADHSQERGARMAATNMALFGGAFFTPILVGKITHTLGWWWTFYFIAIFAGAAFPLVFFLVPETAYRRPDYLNTDFSGDPDASRTNTPPSIKEMEQGNGHSHSHSHGTNGTNTPTAKASFVSTLLPFNGRKTDENFFKLLLRPFPLFFHPAILWACLIQGTLIGWTVLIGVVLAAIFLGPPLWFDEVQTGYFYAGPFIGAFVGFLFAGVFTDWVTRVMIRRNGGVYEPEFRIVLVAPQLIVGCLGLYGFGWASSNVQPGGWFLPDFFFALEVAGMVIGAVASALYIVDAYRSFPAPYDGQDEIIDETDWCAQATSLSKHSRACSSSRTFSALASRGAPTTGWFATAS